MTLPSSGPLSLSDIQGEFGGSNPIGLNEYYAGGGLVPSGTTGTYGAVPTSGQISVQNFYGTSNIPPTYIEEVFSTWLYVGTGTPFSINNSIDLAGNGGLVWLKRRDAANSHWLYYQPRKYVNSNTDNPGGTSDPGYGITSYNSDGFSLGYNWGGENSGGSFVSWTFRKQPKFFDIVTYTGNGANRTIAHNLGSVPGCIMVKCLSTANTLWSVYHRSLANTQYMVLNATAGAATGTTYWNSTTPTSTVFSLGTDSTVNANGATYVAYLFAHNAGGFGSTGSDNVISCGSLTTDASGNATATLGYEPQFVILKCVDPAFNWGMWDNMRGFGTYKSGTNWSILYPNLNNAQAGVEYCTVTSTELKLTATSTNRTFIYIAIRRGPMKVPTSGTSVFKPYSTSNDVIATDFGFPIDSIWEAVTGGGGSSINTLTAARLTGNSSSLITSSVAGAQVYFSSVFSNTTQNAYIANVSGGVTAVQYGFRRAPNFFDVVCYNGTGSNTTQTHNLGVAPEMIIVKFRPYSGYSWATYSSALGATKFLLINSTAGEGTNSTYWNNTAPTASVFSVGTSGDTNLSGQSYIAYLFATCPGVSKVGSYTGTGALQTINCGFTGGARFVLIKRTDTSGDWYVYDSARGISSGSDPYILLNTTAPEVTGTNYVDTTSVGFQVTAAAPAGLNANGGTYIFLAIA